MTIPARQTGDGAAAAERYDLLYVRGSPQSHAEDTVCVAGTDGGGNARAVI